MRIAIASDHAGFALKQQLKTVLAEKGHEVRDFGPSSDESTDYPDYGALVGRAVSEGQADRGVLICGSGIGMCMVANRFPKVRAAVLRDENDALMSRRHNDANVACFGGRVTEPDLAAKLIDLFLSTEFEGGRHARRVGKIDKAC
jgi:ribose 5-phosphate isomerase B